MKRPVNKGQTCRRWRRVKARGLGGRRVLRCAAYVYPPRRPGGIGYGRGHRPDNKGQGCKRYALVYSPWFNKKVYRCADFDGVRRHLPRSLARSAVRAAGLLPITARALVSRRKPVKSGKVKAAAQLVYGYIPLSLRSMEMLTPGRTPARR